MERYFPGKISFNTNCKNPWRNDTNGRAYFDYNNGNLIFIDWASEKTHMDCFYVAQKALELDSFKDVCNTIAKDFNLGLHRPKSLDDYSTIKKHSFVSKKPRMTQEIKKNEIGKARIAIVTQKFNEIDLRYWFQYHITLPTLIKFRVRACHRAWIRGDFYYEYKQHDPMYVYAEKQEDFKLYRPRAAKFFKWRSNMVGGILECWEQLPEKGEILILTKSRKDVMTLHECGYSSVACKSESSLVSNNAINLLKKRFKHIIVFYDNDEAGKIYSTKIKEEYDLTSIELPQNKSGDLPKDPSDFIQVYGKKSLIKFLHENISRNIRQG
jgi:5S rRNA maturation endonuclease (ribonuclease M5)